MGKKLRQVCECTKCGSEAEMEIECSWVDFEEAEKAKKKDQKADIKVKGTGTCTHCGGEADMWIDL